MELVSVYPVTLLKKCQALYEQMGIKTGWADPTKEAPFHSLLVRFEEVGARNSFITLQLSFLPYLEEAASEGINILQTFVAIIEGVSSTTVGELLKATAKINTQLALGAFGLFEESGILYFKYNSIVKDLGNEEATVKLIDQQTGLILHQHFLFLDTLLDVAEGIKPADEALRAAPLLQNNLSKGSLS